MLPCIKCLCIVILSKVIIGIALLSRVSFNFVRAQNAKMLTETETERHNFSTSHMPSFERKVEAKDD
jgi:hypothetical protein